MACIQMSSKGNFISNEKLKIGSRQKLHFEWKIHYAAK